MLKIVYVELHQDVVDSILSGCPVLCHMNLIMCWGFNSLKINSPSVHSFEVFNCCDKKEDRTLLEISAPYLKDLHLYVNPTRSKLQLTNISSLEKACIDLILDESWDPKLAPENEMNDVKELFETTLHIAELELCPSFFEVLTVMVGNGCQLPQSRRISLTIETKKQNIFGIISLLESSPNLEKLEVQGEWDPEEPPCWCPAAKEDLNCNLEKLKIIKINDYAEPSLGGEPLLTLARILLKRAKVLENMRIVSSSYHDEDQDEFNELDDKVFSYPTLSQTVEIENYRWIPPRS